MTSKLQIKIFTVLDLLGKLFWLKTVFQQINMKLLQNLYLGKDFVPPMKTAILKWTLI